MTLRQAGGGSGPGTGDRDSQGMRPGEARVVAGVLGLAGGHIVFFVDLGPAAVLAEYIFLLATVGCSQLHCVVPGVTKDACSDLIITQNVHT